MSTNRDVLREIKHAIKIAIGRPDPSWAFYRFERDMNPSTRAHSLCIRTEAEARLADKTLYESEDAYRTSTDPVVVQGHALKLKAEREFKNKLASTENIRILVHIPSEAISPGGYSLFTNFAESFAYLGIPTRILGWDEKINQALDEFKPTILITTDHTLWLEKIDWKQIEEYKKQNTLRVGLSAMLEEHGTGPLRQRLKWARENKISFFYSFRDPGYINSRPEYQPYKDAGFPILHIPFGANILHYYPVPGFKRDLNYSFLASVNTTKGERYAAYMLPIMKKYSGYLDGPGWKHIPSFSFNRDRDRYIYARTKVGLNIHLEEQIIWANEVNERTYQLAACGVPQVIDNAKLLPNLFAPDTLFVARNPAEYQKHFMSIIKDPSLGEKHALAAQKEVFEKYTTFHRAEGFIEQLRKL